MKKFVAPTLARYVRRPVFNLAGAMRPFGLYPIQASPVLAGDTVMYSMLRGRFISQPMKHPITGGWLEFWQVFVPMRVIGRTATVNDIAPPTTGLVYTADAPRFFGKNTQLDHVRAAYLKVVTDFFTQTGVTVPDFDGVKQLPMMGTDWAENLMLRPASANPAVWPQQNVTEELTGLDVETERQLIESADYRAFTQQFGVKDPEADNRSRIVRYVRAWAQPQVVIDPASGAPRSAFFFDQNIANEKPFRAQEHGIHLVLCAFRPVMFKRLADSSVIGRMNGLKHWLPPRGNAAWDTIQGNDPVFKAGFGLVGDNLVYDRSDVFARGEYQINCVDADTPFPVPKSSVGTATGTLADQRGYYATAAEIDGLFVGTNAIDRRMHYAAMFSKRVNGFIQEVAPE